MTTPPLRVGILGAANIARSFVEGARPSKRVTVSAVASRDAGKALAFAREFAVARHFGSYEALLADREIDAVYIPLPNSLHAEWSIRAAEAGKHVLCEKPLSATAGEARAMFDAARQHGVHLVEGYPYRAQPQTLKLRELLDAGVIGDVRLIQASFGFTLGPGENIRLSPQLAGGALMDIGTYPVSLVRMIAKARPRRVHAVADWSGGVDRALAATLQFDSGLFAQITCSFSTCLHRQALIAGSNGVIQTTYLNHTTPPQAVLRLRVGTDRGAVDSTVQTSAINGFLAEAEAFERLVRGGPTQWSGTTPEESIDIMLTLDAIRTSARSGGAVEIPADR
jgi:D-xylose 1-dehydrogenase (NADP+, D-xylono-1,5-lactone-forming)